MATDAPRAPKGVCPKHGEVELVPASSGRDDEWTCPHPAPHERELKLPDEPTRVMLGGVGHVFVEQVHRVPEEGPECGVAVGRFGSATVELHTPHLEADAPTFVTLYRRALQRRLTAPWLAVVAELNRTKEGDDLYDELLDARRRCAEFRPPPEDYPRDKAPGVDRLAWCSVCDAQTIRHAADGPALPACSNCGLETHFDGEVPWLDEHNPGKYAPPWWSLMESEE